MIHQIARKGLLGLISFALIETTAVQAAVPKISVKDAGDLCGASMAYDTKYKVCGYLASLKAPPSGTLWRQVISMDAVDNAVIMDLRVATSFTNGPAGQQPVAVLPKMVNVTAGDDFSARYFYDGTCENADCTTMLFKSLDVQPSFKNELVLVFNDPRLQVAGGDASSMGFQINYQFVNGKGARRLSTEAGTSFQVPQAEGWLRVKNTPTQSIMLLVNIIGVSVALVAYLSVILRRFVSIRCCSCCKCPSLEMRQEIPYSDIIKKFTAAEETLRGPFDGDDIEKQNLLKGDAEAEEAIAEDSADQVTISDVVSHATIDSKGAEKIVKVAREQATKEDIQKHIFKKKVQKGEVMHFVPTEQNIDATNNAGIVVDRSESEDYGLLSQATKGAGAVPPKSKIEEMFSSEGQRTQGDQKQPGGIEASKSKRLNEEDEERGGPAETPPHFQESEVNEDDLKLGVSIHDPAELDAIQRSQDNLRGVKPLDLERLDMQAGSDNETPTPYGSIIGKSVRSQVAFNLKSFRDGSKGKGRAVNLTQRSNLTAGRSSVDNAIAEGAPQKSTRKKSPYLIKQRLVPSAERSKQSIKRAETPADDAKVLLNEDSQTIGQLSLLEQGLYMGKISTSHLDAFDKQALKRWKKTVKRSKKQGMLKVNDDEELNDLRKIVNLYKIYGNDNVALVNPAENPGVLLVRTRSAEKRKLGRQVIAGSGSQFSQMRGLQSKVNVNSAAAMTPNAMAVRRAYDMEEQGSQGDVDIPDPSLMSASVNPKSIAFGANTNAVANPAQAHAIMNPPMSQQQNGRKPRWGKQPQSVSHMTPSANQKAFRGFKNVTGLPPPGQVQQAIRMEDASVFANGPKEKINEAGTDMQTSAAHNRTTHHESGSNVQRTNVMSHDYADSSVQKNALSRNLIMGSNSLLPSGTEKEIEQSVLRTKDSARYNENGSPRVPTAYIEVDVNNPAQLSQIAQDMAARKARKHAQLGLGSGRGSHRSLSHMRSDRSVGNAV